MKQGRITISRITSNVENEYIVIALRANGSPLPVMEIKLTPEQLGIAITGMGNTPCEWSEPRKDREEKPQRELGEPYPTTPRPDEVTK